MPPIYPPFTAWYPHTFISPEMVPAWPLYSTHRLLALELPVAVIVIHLWAKYVMAPHWWSMPHFSIHTLLCTGSEKMRQSVLSSAMCVIGFRRQTPADTRRSEGLLAGSVQRHCPLDPPGPFTQKLYRGLKMWSLHNVQFCTQLPSQESHILKRNNEKLNAVATIHWTFPAPLLIAVIVPAVAWATVGITFGPLSLLYSGC